MHIPSEHWADWNESHGGHNRIGYGQWPETEAIKAKIGASVDAEDMERQLAALQRRYDEQYTLKSERRELSIII